MPKLIQAKYIHQVYIAKRCWKADGREEEQIEIKQTEVIKRTFLKSGIPEFS
jgi:hypothetical protein